MTRLLAILAIAALVAFDQFTKWLSSASLPFQQAVEIVPFFALYLTHNTGIAFSMFSSLGDKGLIVLATVVMALVLFLWSRVEKHRPLAHAGFALIIAGAIGNVIDRATLGYVVDMFLFYTQSWSFAVFNVADAYISVGAAAIILDEFIAWRRQANAAKQTTKNDT